MNSNFYLLLSDRVILCCCLLFRDDSPAPICPGYRRLDSLSTAGVPFPTDSEPSIQGRKVLFNTELSRSHAPQYPMRAPALCQELAWLE
jgi:hypothetical protein